MYRRIAMRLYRRIVEGFAHALVQAIPLDGTLPRPADQSYQIQIRHMHRGMGPRLMVDPLVDDGTLDIIAAEAQRNLRKKRRDHGPMRLHVRNVVQKQPSHCDVLKVLVSRGSATDPPHLLTQLVVIRVIGERDVGEEPSGLILQSAECAEMLDPVLSGLHVPVEHGTIGWNPQFVRDSVDLDPFVSGKLSLGDGGPNRGTEDLCSTTRQTGQAGLLHRGEYLTLGRLLNPGEVCDLDRCERLD